MRTGGLSDGVVDTTFVGEGEVRARCRALDWAATPLGPVSRWPEALRAVVRACLESPFPINLWCGPELVLVYNDAYRRVLGDKHPQALGRRGSEVWAEIWDGIAPMFDAIRAGGPTVYEEDRPFVVARGGQREEVWFTFSLSAVRDEGGELIAFLNVVSETTARMLAERESRTARAAAEGAEARLREVFDQAPSFHAVLRGPEHVFEYANAAYYQLIGHREIIGRPVLEAIPEVRGQGFEALLDDVLTTGRTVVRRETPIQLQREPGAPLEERILDFTYMAFTEPDGTRSGVIAHGVDLTEQVRARQQVEAVLGSISDAFCALDREWRFTYVNRRAAQLLGREPAELLDRDVRKEFQPAMGTILEHELRRCVETGTPTVFETYYEPLRTRFEIRAYPAADGLAVYFQDVTERHRAAETLAESERRFRLVQDASPDASLLAQAVRGPDGTIVDLRFTYANAATQSILIGGPEIVVGRTMRDAFPESVEAGRLDAYARVVETGEPWQRELFYTRGAIAHGLRVTAVKVGDGVHIAAVDLSERMRAEAERERLLADAERARAEAEAASRAKSEFLAIMSHELRTPLNAIGGYADLLLLGVRGELTPGQREDVERMRRSNQHLLGLINDVLNFAKLEAGQVEYRVGPVSVAALLDGLEDLVRPQLAAKAVRYRREPCDDALRASADPEKVRQIILNLLANAVKFTAPGGEVALSCEAVGDRALVRVRDTGRGIPAEKLATIFEPFVQVDRHLTPASQQGVGLGLAISRDLARGMSGDLTAESTIGEGSTFTLTLPRAP